MKKHFSKKLFFTLLLSIVFAILLINTNVMAATLEEIEEILQTTEDKLMIYNIETGVERELDMDELNSIVSTKNSVSSNSSILDSYTPTVPPTTTTLAPTDEAYLAFAEADNSSQRLALASANSVQRITNTSGDPYCKTARIYAKDHLNFSVYGTASIVGPNLALTCAHCVFDENNNFSNYLNWTIYAGYNNGTYYGTATGWSNVIYLNSFKTNPTVENDWAICVLQANVGNQVGWYGLQAYGSNSELNGTAIRVLGYPNDSSYGFPSGAIYQYQTGEKITTTYNNYFKYSGWPFEGFSGGPVMRTSDNYIVGIHNGIAKDSSGTPLATRVSQTIIDVIRDYK